MLQRFLSRRAFVALGLVLGAALALGSGAAFAHDDDDDDDGGGGRGGAVYVQTNQIPNAVRVFFRNAQGELRTGPVVLTGGAGSTVNPPFGLPLTDSQDSVVLTQDNRILLVTNAGSDTVSSFRVRPDGNIVLADQKPSGGDLPISVTATNTGGHGALVYVLNENTQSVSGLRLDRDGTLTPIPGSTRSVTGMFSATVGFDTTGRVLTVATREPYAPPAAMGSISTWKVRRSGLLGPEIVTLMTPENSGTGGPFGFDYTRRDQLIVAESGASSFAGSAASFDVWPRTATVTPISSGFLTGALTCWAKVARNDKYAYLTNPGTADISGFTISPHGVLAPNGTTSTALQGSPLDLDTSENERFLYVLHTDISPTFAFGDSRVAGYRIERDGSLTLINVAEDAGSGGTSGLAAY